MSAQRMGVVTSNQSTQEAEAEEPGSGSYYDLARWKLGWATWDPIRKQKQPKQNKIKKKNHGKNMCKKYHQEAEGCKDG